MTVLAHCSDCGSTHKLGSRPAVEGTTECPDCGSTSYGSEVVDADETDRIVDVAESTPGIGKSTAENIADRMVTMDRLRDATVSELRSIPGVGEQNSKALAERVG